MANQHTKRRKAAMTEDHREKIQVSHIIRRLSKHVEGEVEMTTSQISAAKILLGKVLPDLQATQLTGEMTTNYVARMPTKSESAEEWQQMYSPTLQ